MHLPVIETGALPWKGSMLPLHQRCLWRTRASIPLPLACKASALPFELVPLFVMYKIRTCAGKAHQISSLTR